MRWIALARVFGLMAAIGCSTPLGTTESETDSSSPQQDLGSATSSPGQPPTAAADAGQDAGSVDASAAPAADSGKPEQTKPAPAPHMEPLPPPRPPLTLSFSPEGGGYAAPVELSVKAADDSAEVHYTLDGNIPSSSSPVANGALHLEKTTLVRAVAVRGGELGAVTNQVYFQIAADAREFRSDLPVIVIDMQSNSPPDAFSREYTSALFGAFEPMAGSTRLESRAALTSRVGIKVRGRSTRYQEKHSYNLELRGRDQEDAPAPLLGMPADGDWVLYAPYASDRSLMHNTFGYALSRRIGRYAPRTSYCELFLVSHASGVAQASYAGIYVLTERISRGAQRVPVKKLRPEDTAAAAVTGGYIVQMNEPDEPDEGFTAAGNRFLYVHPNDDEAQPEQTAYIAGYIESVTRDVSAADGVDPMSGQHYSELIDVAAFVDHHILSVLVKNPDAFALSSYFYKDRGAPLVAGPLWDLDLGMAGDDAWGQRSVDPTQWSPAGQDFFARSFWGPLFTHAEFETAYWARWRELLADAFQVSQLQLMVTDLEHQLSQAEPRNSARWPASAPRNNSLSDEAGALRAWLAARVEWITAKM